MAESALLDLKIQDKSLKKMKRVSSLVTPNTDTFQAVKPTSSILLKINFFTIFARTLPVFLRVLPIFTAPAETQDPRHIEDGVLCDIC